jgi:MYXO-CTERM domain-containing protein
MWQQAAAQVVGQVLGASEAQSRGPTISGVERLGYSADGYTVATGGARATGGTVSRGGEPFEAIAAPIGNAMNVAAANPAPWVLGAAAIAVLALLIRRRKSKG